MSHIINGTCVAITIGVGIAYRLMRIKFRDYMEEHNRKAWDGYNAVFGNGAHPVREVLWVLKQSYQDFGDPKLNKLGDPASLLLKATLAGGVLCLVTLIAGV